MYASASWQKQIHWEFLKSLSFNIMAETWAEISQSYIIGF
jgi:hypothetical protein